MDEYLIPTLNIQMFEYNVTCMSFVMKLVIIHFELASIMHTCLCICKQVVINYELAIRTTKQL